MSHATVQGMVVAMGNIMVTVPLGGLAGLATLLLWLGLRARPAAQAWPTGRAAPPAASPAREGDGEPDPAALPDAQPHHVPVPTAPPRHPRQHDLHSLWQDLRGRAPRDQRWLTRQFYRAGLPLSRRELALAAGIGGSLAFLLGWALGHDLRWGAASVLMLIGTTTVIVRSLVQRRSVRFDEEFLHVLQLMLTSRRAGLSMPQALAMVAAQTTGPARMEFDLVRREILLGRDSTQALRHLNERLPNEDLKLLIDALVLHMATGGDLIPVLEMLVDTVRQRTNLRREVRALTAQGRLSSYVLGALPVLVGLALYLLDPIDMSFFWTSPSGVALLLVALVSVAIGYTLIRRIVAVRL